MNYYEPWSLDSFGELMEKKIFEASIQCLGDSWSLCVASMILRDFLHPDPGWGWKLYLKPLKHWVKRGQARQGLREYRNPYTTDDKSKVNQIVNRLTIKSETCKVTRKAILGLKFDGRDTLLS